MLAKKLFAVGLAGTLGAALALPANAQMRTSERVIQVPVVAGAQLAGPTRVFTVPRANVLGMGNNIISTSVFLGASAQPIAGQPALGLGLAGNALNLRANMGLADNFELGTGIGYIAGAPWQGQLDVTGKWALFSEDQGAIASLAGLAGGLLSVDANGTPNVGVQLGIPISKMFAFNDVNFMNLTVYPNYNLGVLQPTAILPGVAGQAAPLNFLALGLGGTFGLTDRLHVLADTNLGVPVVGVNTQSNLGVRYAFTRDFVGDAFVGFNPGPNLGFGQTPASFGVGAHWGF